MNKDKNKFIPELRFPEFKSDENWKIEKVDHLIKQHIEKSDFSNQYPVLTSSREGIMFQRDYYDNRDVASKDNTGYNVVPRGYFTYRHMSDDIIFKFNINTICDRGIVSTLYPVFDVKQDKIIPYFLQIVLNEGQEFKKFSLSQKQGGSRTYMYLSKLKELGIIIPAIKEQQRIADCLSSLDELITAHNDKLETLKTYKKGLMQNLFPQEGEKVPKLRFKEFEKDGEWENIKIENYIELFSGIALKSEEISDDRSGIPILRGINITEGYVRHSKDIDKFYLGDLDNLKKYLVKENDLVIGMDGSKVGKNVALVRKEDENSILIQRVARIRTKKTACIKYVYQHIISDSFRNYVDRVNTSSGIPHISSQQIKDFKIGFPPTLNEQQKIAEILSTLDDIIRDQVYKIKQLKSHKKGLIQGLFPKVSN